MLKSAGLLFVANILFAVFNLARNVALARLLSVEAFGIAATFNILMNIQTMAFGLGLGQLQVQDKAGEDARFQGTLHSLQLTLGLATGMVVFLCAGLYAALMGVPDLAWGFQLMAGLTVLQGVLHMDVYRQQRGRRFLPFALFTTLPLAVSLASVWPLYLWLGDHRVMLGALIVQIATACAVTHGTARRPFRLAWDRAVARRALLFGGPLFFNGLLLFVILNGERVIVANRFGLEALGWFSAAFMLTLMAASLILRTLQTMFLPALAARQDQDAPFARGAVAACQASLVVAMGTAVGFALFGPTLIFVLYGEKYLPAAGFMVLLAVMQAGRIARSGPVVVGLAKAQSKLALYTSLARVAVLPLAILAVLRFEAGIEMLIVIGIGGELLAAGLAFALMARWSGVALRPLAPALALTAGLLAWVGGQAFGAPAPGHMFAGVHWGQLLPLALLALSPLVMGELRGELLHRLRRR